jgi:aspartyl-tRNA(Asn)/glutamyl-tRNA(Gln) amidotransferase subunit B
LNTTGQSISDAPLAPAALARLLTQIDTGVISGKMAKVVFEEMTRTGEEAAPIIARRGLTQLSDQGELARIVDDVLAAAPDEVAAYRGGKTKLMGFFVGQVMQATRGQANPRKVNEILKDRLAG